MSIQWDKSLAITSKSDLPIEFLLPENFLLSTSLLLIPDRPSSYVQLYATNEPSLIICPSHDGKYIA